MTHQHLGDMQHEVQYIHLIIKSNSIVIIVSNGQVSGHRIHIYQVSHDMSSDMRYH